MLHATASALFLAASLLASTFGCDASTTSRPSVPRSESTATSTRSLPTITPAKPAPVAPKTARPAAPASLPAHLFM